MSEVIELRLATPADAPAIAVMSRDLVEPGLGWSWTAPRVVRKVRCADTVVLVAQAGPRVVGFAIMHFGWEEAHLNLLAVSPRYRRGGVGRRLLQWLERSALVAGIPAIYLEARAGNGGAVAFYEAIGYRRLGRIPRYYRGREDAVRMGRDLRRAVSGGAPDGPA